MRTPRPSSSLLQALSSRQAALVRRRCLLARRHLSLFGLLGCWLVYEPCKDGTGPLDMSCCAGTCYVVLCRDGITTDPRWPDLFEGVWDRWAARTATSSLCCAVLCCVVLCCVVALALVFVQCAVLCRAVPAALRTATTLIHHTIAQTDRTNHRGPMWSRPRCGGRVSASGGLALVHSTLTNAVNRPWLRGLLAPPVCHRSTKETTKKRTTCRWIRQCGSSL